MLAITVEAFPGDTIRETAFAMASLSKKLNVCVQCRFNGVLVFALPTASSSAVVTQYEQAIRRDRDKQKEAPDA